ncbi:MAG: alginate lyase family protein [Clostridia bacterium]
MQISEFFKIFDLSRPSLEKVNYYVASHDYNSAKKELLSYFITRKKYLLSTAEPICEKDKNFPLAYISRYSILSGPNEADCYFSSMFVTKTDGYTTLDVLPFIKNNFSFMLMSRQKESSGALFYSPNSIFPPYISIKDKDGKETRISPDKFAFVSPKSPDEPLYAEDIYEICEESALDEEALGTNTGRVYLSFNLSDIERENIASARFCAKISPGNKSETKEILLFNIADNSWNHNLTWNSIKGNVYSWESSPTGPFWNNPPGSDSEYLNVTCRFWFARPMAYQYLSDVDKNKIYGEKLLFLMDAFSKKKEGGFNRVLETGERLSNFACVLNALIDTPVMNADFLVSILWMMYRDMKSLMENPDLGWSNWAVVRTSGLSKAIDFLPELKEHDEWKTKTRSLMSELFDRMYSPDFSFREAGFAYSFWCMDLFISAFKVAEMNNDPYNAFMRSRLEKAFDASLDLIYPNFYDTNIGDSNYSDKTDYLKTGGKLFPTKKLISFVNGKDDPSVPLSCMYEDASVSVLRNTFNKQKGMYILFHENPFDGHAHNDLGSMVLYASSRVLLTDSGRYGYTKGDISTYLKTPAAHNTIEIEDAVCSSHSEAKSKITHFASNSMFDFTKGTASPYTDIDAVHQRSIFFVKDMGFVIVSDFVTCSETARKFNQNWNFMPFANPKVDYSNNITTSFPEGVNLTLSCPASDMANIKDTVFSAGYGVCEDSQKGIFTKFGQNISMTTLLLPHNGEVKVSSASLNPKDLSFGSAMFDIDGKKAVFYTKNTTGGTFLDFTFDGESAFILGDRIYLAYGKTLSANGVNLMESPKEIKDIYLHVSGGVVTIESSSLKLSTNRQEAVKIYAPKTTHVLFNGNPIPFTLYSDYVYALAPI